MKKTVFAQKQVICRGIPLQIKSFFLLAELIIMLTARLVNWNRLFSFTALTRRHSCDFVLVAGDDYRQCHQVHGITAIIIRDVMDILLVAPQLRCENRNYRSDFKRQSQFYLHGKSDI